MVNDNLLSSPIAKKTVRFQATIDHVTEAVSSNTNLSNDRLPSTTTDSCPTVIESSSLGMDNDKDEYKKMQEKQQKEAIQNNLRS